MTSILISGCIDSKFIYNHAIIKEPRQEEFELHTHDICELLFIKKGDVSGVINGRTYALKKNSLIIFRPQVIHKIQINSNTDYERINILFDEKAIANRIFETVPKTLDVINYSGNNYIIDVFSKFDFYYTNFKGENLRKLSENLIEEIVFNLSLAGDENESDDLVTVNSMIDKVIDYIDNNFERPITIEEICNELFISKSHLHHMFRDSFNMTPKKYINLQRLSKARNLIRNGVKPHDVYLLCGFKDYSSFYRSYKMYFGHIPSEEVNTEIERKIKS